MSENKNYYKKKLYLILLALALIFAFHGLYSYYEATIERPWQLISAVLYGTIKMFLFVAPLPADGDTSITYEIAKWLAPILTSALVLTKVTNALFHFRNSVKNRLSNNHLIIFERTEMTNALIHNLQKQGKYQLSLICKNPIPEEWKAQYEKNGIAVYIFDFHHASPKEIREIFYRLRFDFAKALIFGALSDLENYSLFVRLIKEMKPDRAINCYIHCDSSSIPSYLEEVLTMEKMREPKLAQLDVTTFNQDELSIRMLFQQIGGKNGLLHKNLESLRDFALQKKEITVENLESALGEVHFLVIGANALAEKLLIHTANDATLSIREKIKVTIVDYHPEEKMESFFASNEEILSALDVKMESLRLRNRSLTQFFASMKKPSAIFILPEDAILNLEILNIANRFFKNVPKVVRNISGVNIEPMLPANYDELKIFGDIREIMNDEVLINFTLDERAKQFNKSYNKTSELAGMGGGSSWDELSQTKKSSSRASAAHSRVKEEILRILYPDKSEDEIREQLRIWFEEFHEMQDRRHLDEDHFQKEFGQYLEKYPILDFLSRLEHQRWCHSYYAMNFRYGEKKDEVNRTHPCLIEDWQKIMGEAFSICHPEYDLLATLALFPKEES